MSMCAYFHSIKPKILNEVKQDPDLINELIFEQEDHEGFADLHKSWHSLHFLLSGSAWDVQQDKPLSKAVLGGEEIGEDAFGYGPARFLTPDEVKVISTALQLTDPQALIAKYKPEDFKNAELYAFGDYDDEVSEMIDYYAELKDFYRKAAEQGNAVVTYIQ